jgi:hypothetical protein
MAGYVGKQYHADTVLWMAQSREEREDELMRILVSKNRNGLTGSINLSTDYSYMTFYHEAVVEEEGDNGDTTTTTTSSTEADPLQGKDDLQLLLTASESEKSSSPDGTDG